jgi:hypothetical protein
MKTTLLRLNDALLFACVSMYFGTGWSLLLFQFPIIPKLTPDNYYMQFVPAVDAATRFFTYMTILMMVLAIVMIVSEWKSGWKWVPIVVLLAVIAATALTRQYILPINDEMRNGIRDAVQLQEVLARWSTLNRVRVSLWTVQWLAMMIYYAARTTPGREGTR